MARPRKLDLTELRRQHSFASLVRRHVGLMDGVSFLPLDLGAVDLEVAATSLGNLTMTLPHVRGPTGGDVRGTVIGGGSADIDPALAWVRAVAEGAERYATMVYSESDFIVDSAAGLAGAALDLRRIARCSAAEYADPHCPLQAPREDTPIRWVRGFSLVDGTERLVPAVMVHLHLQPWPAERFWLPISTGVAAHTHLRAALTAALCEGIERDAIALWWLLRLPLPRLRHPTAPSLPLAALLERLDASAVQHHAFDATTDLGIPTVLAVQVTEGDPDCELFVSCATCLDPEVAFAKAIREASPARAVLRRAPPCPDSVLEFCEITHGASYYGRGGHRDDFRFLLDGTFETALPATAPRSDDLDFLVGRLREHGMDAIAVDLTTDELRDVGLWVVRVIVPELVPISFVSRARYLGTPRLEAYARARSGGRPTDFNPGPLPFA